jgi:hypothetical protein
VCSGFGYGKNKLREGGNQGFWFFRGGKLEQGLGGKPEHGSGGKPEQGLGGKPEHGSGGKILLTLPEEKDHRALVLG